jgi:hypothetical protein
MALAFAEYRKMDKLKYHIREYIKQDVELEIKLCTKILVSVSAHHSQAWVSLAV